MSLSTTLHDPYPVSPRHGAVAEVPIVLRWEPTDSAVRYSVEVADDTAFEHIVYAQEVPSGVEALAVKCRVPEDDLLEEGRPFYWRVRAGSSTGVVPEWSPGEQIESFICTRTLHTEDYPDADTAEPFGPVAALFQHATLDAVHDLGRRYSHHADEETAVAGENETDELIDIEVLGTSAVLLAAVSILLGTLLFFLFSAC